MLLLIIGLFLLIICIIIIIVYFLSSKSRNIDTSTRYDEIKDQLQTGDIMLFVCIKHSNKIDDMLYYSRTRMIGSDYGHVGLVLREGEKLYMVECTDANHCAEEQSYHLNDYGLGGVRIIDLDILVDVYTKEYGGIFAVKHISKAIPNEMFYDAIHKHSNKIFENKQYLTIMLIASLFIPSDILKFFTPDPMYDNKIYCSEMVYAVLRDCGVLAEYNQKLFWPYLFTNKIFDNLQLIPYSDVITFKL